MPRYFFNLSFGQRTVPDEEGVELPNRMAARDEALAVVRDLANPEHSGCSRRWASWFLEVADETGGFFRTPIGHPALEIVTPETNTSGLEQPVAEPLRPGPIAPRTAIRAPAACSSSAEIAPSIILGEAHFAQHPFRVSAPLTRPANRREDFRHDHCHP